jgi:hypothetical protein
VVVGDGPALDRLRRRYGDVHFLGRAALAALELRREDARAHALGYGWRASAGAFRKNILIANHRDGTCV